MRRCRRGKKLFDGVTYELTTSTPWNFDAVSRRNSTAPRSKSQYIAVKKESYRVFTRSSKRPALRLLEVCWTFARSCKHPILHSQASSVITQQRQLQSYAALALQTTQVTAALGVYHCSQISQKCSPLHLSIMAT